MFSGLEINLLSNALWVAGGAAVASSSNVFRLNGRLTGRWEGTLTCVNSADRPETRLQTHVFRCVLVLAKPTSGLKPGILYYTRECTARNEILRRGLDELDGCKRTAGSMLKPEISMDFKRVFHLRPDGELDYSPASWGFTCKLDGLASGSPILRIQTSMFEDDTFSSIWAGNVKKV